MPAGDDERSLIGLQTWYGEPPAARPVFVTYSFPVGPRPEIPGGGEDFMSFFDEAQKSYAREAIAAWGAVCGVTFVETTTHVGDVTFQRYDWKKLSGINRRWSDSGGPVPAGIFDENGIPRVRLAWTNDLPIQEGVTGIVGTTGVSLTSSSITPAQQFYALLHEVGHVLGLNRPWEDDLSRQMVMIDTNVAWINDAPAYTMTLSPMVGRAAQLLYGPPIPPGGPVPWSWDAASETLTQSSTADRALVRGTNARDIITVTGKDAAVATMRGDDIVYTAGQSVEINVGSGFDIVHTGLRYGALTTPRDWGLAAVLIEAGAVRQYIVGAERVVFENGVYDTTTRQFIGDSGIATPSVIGWRNMAGGGGLLLELTKPPDMELEFSAAHVGQLEVTGSSVTDTSGEGRVTWRPWSSSGIPLSLSAKAVSIYGVQSEPSFVLVVHGGLHNDEDHFTDASADPRAMVVGGTGNDTVIGSPGDDAFLLGAGSDTVRYPGGRDEYRIGINSNFTIVEGPQGRDVLRDVDQLAFADTGAITIANLRSTADSLIYYTQNTSYWTGGRLVSGTTFTDYALAAPYIGPVAWLERQFITAAGSEAVVGTARAEFFNLGAGDDAASGGAGNDVLDGGTGSSFLSGGTGRDVFFADGRLGRTSWSTITDWEVGEELTLWGWLPGISSALWVASGGASGWSGVTMHADLDANGSFDASITWTGKTQAALPTPVELDGLLWFR